MAQYLSDLAELKRIVEDERKKGKKIIFGNGCFDLLHVGHVRYLKGAKELGDVLIVAVNDDSSVAGLGKRKKSITPVAERVEIISSICYVDYVITFSEPTVERLLLELKPDVQAKGTDYTPETVPEREVVRSYGGEVAIVGDRKDHSTTDLISMIKERGS